MAEIQRSVELETVCSLLENEHRRRALRALENASGTMTRTELSRVLARDGPGTEPARQIEISLYHVHLPKLAGANAIRYDFDTVAITGEGERLLECLDAMEERLTGRE